MSIIHHLVPVFIMVQFGVMLIGFLVAMLSPNLEY